MSLPAEIREEAPGDADALRRVHDAAFGRPEEGRLVDRLREQGAAVLSLVAIVGERVVGHVLYTPVRLESPEGDLEGAGLAPMGVLPDSQRKGIGSALVAAGTERLRARGCPFVVVLGHPHYYPRFGFEPASRRGVRCEWDVPEDVFRLLVLDPARCEGRAGLARYRPEFAEVA